MRICYVLLSPTWGMHQYTAGLANRMAGNGHSLELVTTAGYPADRYGPEVWVYTPVATRDRGFSPEGLRVGAVRRVVQAVCGTEPDVVHFTGPHVWNPLVMRCLAQAGLPTVHSLHDLHPHAGAVYGRLLYGWNGWVRRTADHLLVHGRRYREELLAAGVPPWRLTCTPLTHLFVGHERERALLASPPEVAYEPWALFIGRLEAYKGLDVLVEAARRVEGQGSSARSAGIVIAGPGRLEKVVRGPLPANVAVRERLILDDEAVDLFSRCGLVVLPYVEASQSALVAAAYAFQKPVVVTGAGALPEYVVEGETGWIVPPGDAGALAGRLAAALADPARLARMGQAGRAWCEEQRQAEGWALEEMYARLLERGKSKGQEGPGG